MCNEILEGLEPFFGDDVQFTLENEKELITQLHDAFIEDFVTNPFQVDGSMVRIKVNLSKHLGLPAFFGQYGHDFVHLITRRSDYTNRRVFEPNRAQRIHWIKPILQNCHERCIKCYKFTESNGKDRDYFWYEEKKYIVILERISEDYWLISGHCVDDEQKHRRRFQKYHFGH